MKKMFPFVKSNFITFSLLIVSTIFNPVFSQSSVKYTLDQVIAIAQKQSPDALMAIHRFRSEYWKFRSFKATYLPNLRLDGTLPNINQSFNTVHSLNGTVSYTPQSTTNYSLDLSLNQKIGLTGGEVFVSSGLAQMNNYLTDSAARQFLSNVVNIGIKQPLFSYNEYKWKKKTKSFGI